MREKEKINVNIFLNKDIYDDLIRFSIALYGDIKIKETIEYLITYFLVKYPRH